MPDADELIAQEIAENGEDEIIVVGRPITDQEIEDAYSGLQFRVIYQSNNFFLPQLHGLVKGREVLNVRPEYQRRLRWSTKKKSQLIESLLLNVPIPPVYFYESEAARYEVMDGQQRINAVYEFFENDFTLTGMEKLEFLNGRRFNRLPPKIRRGLERSSMGAIVLLQETKSDHDDPFVVRRYVFERLNTGGEKLNQQEVRNSLFRGSFNNLIVELARDPVFCQIFQIPIYSPIDENEHYENPERKRNKLYQTMGDCQLVLRFFALLEERNIRGAMSDILDRCMAANQDISEIEIVAHRSLFQSVIRAANDIFEGQPFLLPPDRNGLRRVSAALYDAVCVSIARRAENIPHFVRAGREIQDGVEALARDELELLTGRANTAGAIRERLARVGTVLDQSV